MVLPNVVVENRSSDKSFILTACQKIFLPHSKISVNLNDWTQDAKMYRLKAAIKAREVIVLGKEPSINFLFEYFLCGNANPEPLSTEQKQELFETRYDFYKDAETSALIRGNISEFSNFTPDELTWEMLNWLKPDLRVIMSLKGWNGGRASLIKSV